MPKELRPARRATRLALVSLSGIALLTSVAAPAYADPGPVFPSADQVAGAKAAVTDRAGQVAALDAQLAASRDTVVQMQDAAAAAGEAANGAQFELAQRTKESGVARARADAARAKADEANLALSRYAADVYQQGGGSMGPLDVFFGGAGPQDVLDRAAGLEAVGGERARAMQEAEASNLLAQSLQREASDAEARQAAAAAAAAAAAKKARSDSDHAVTETARLRAQQQAMLQQLATLQNTSVQIEQQRQEGLAAQEEARREELARQVAVAAAAQAAQQAAARAAAQQAAAVAAEQAARSAREQATAAAARVAADEAARRAAVEAAQAPPRTVAPPPPAAPAPQPVVG
ncbi:MAG: hypothetical protein ACR2JN_07620, partial [Lapillicoccus sp.]